ncbi:ethanolamine utilization protein EutQ [Enterococcus sp. PF1-24]|uniref:hypothetical protein n=1 Tax=unclassified Enterococcus TaxID=2608891 RepID=UPI002474BD3F|nr:MULTISPECIES: hypothetical protein [unclassified Enterococcus]MDH6364088.1 ethanolamine utilization protein EutQ [Enterococcus sp. PFB1-1]MDH6401189.1 ethanolamine utilization protein EutQ [Enterococcus sp. PF1-24]
MKKLICIADIYALKEADQKECMITPQTLVTPAAYDVAEELGIAFVEEAEPIVNDLSDFLQQKDPGALLQLLGNQELLQRLTAILQKTPYQSEKDCQGTLLIHGQSIQMESCEKNACSSQLLFKNLFNCLNLKVIEIKAGPCQDLYFEDEVHLILEGCVDFTIENRQYHAEAGDVLQHTKAVKIQGLVKKNLRFIQLKATK